MSPRDWRAAAAKTAKRQASILIGLAIFLASPVQAAWQINHVPITGTALRAITMVDSKTIWVAGSGGLCFRTTDGGKSWHELCAAGMTGLDIRGIAVLDRRNTVVISAVHGRGGQAMLFRTSDGGKSWRKVFDDRTAGAFLDAMSFWDSRHGIALGDPIDGQWYLFSTSDGGNTWQRLHPASIPQLAVKESFLAASNGAMIVSGTSQIWVGSAAMGQPRIFRSMDRGLHWSVAPVPHPQGERVNVIGLANLGGGRMVAVGGDYRTPPAGTANALVSDDDGITWTSTDTGLAPGVRESVGSPGGTTLLSVGTPGSAVSNDLGRHWQPLGIAGLHAIACRKTDCWAAGNDGAVAHWVPDAGN